MEKNNYKIYIKKFYRMVLPCHTEKLSNDYLRFIDNAK